MNNTEDFDIEVSPSKHLLDIDIKDIWRYRDLLRMFVKRDIITVYKQTVLGPIWFFVQPIMTTLIYMVVFGSIANIPTDGIPQPLFYMAGIVLWNYFSDCFNATSDTFASNAGLFGKVYFPRLIVPLSKISSGLIKFFIQLALFVALYVYYIASGVSITPGISIFLLPVFIALMAILALGTGIIFTSLTTKYRDLKFLITFGVQLLMYATPIIYPITAVPDKIAPYIKANPITYIIEGFKYSVFGQGYFSPMGLLYSASFAIGILAIGIIIFNRTERTFMDTV